MLCISLWFANLNRHLFISFVLQNLLLVFCQAAEHTWLFCGEEKKNPSLSQELFLCLGSLLPMATAAIDLLRPLNQEVASLL